VHEWNEGAWTLASHTLFLYDGWNMIAELDELNGHAPVRTYAWGTDLSGTMQGAGGVGGLLFANSHLPTPDSAAYAASFDGNGNVIGLVDLSTGATTATYDYNAFGETVISDGPAADANPFRFSTKYTDNETALLYYGLRYFQPSIGRWLNRDPIEEDGGANLYAFVSNSPVEWIDPLGLALYAFDGTNNDGYRDEPNGNETNVFALFKIYDGNRAYLPGVGTNDGLLNPIGSAFGARGQARESRMLTQAGEFIQGGDTVADIIGFSRGGAQARDFANKLKDKYPCVKIRWIGLFDTVASVGLPNDVNIGYRLGIPKDTGSVLHLTAGGERRRKTFALTSITPGPGQPNANPDYREEEMPDAVHSDVGGFYGKNRGLANQALQRMWRDGLNNGVPFGPLNVRYTNVTPNGPNDSRWFNDKAIEFLAGKKRVRKVHYHP
jgi:RHS repeat-associated protein